MSTAADKLLAAAEWVLIYREWPARRPAPATVPDRALAALAAAVAEVRSEQLQGPAERP